MPLPYSTTSRVMAIGGRVRQRYALPFGVAKRIRISMIVGDNHTLIYGEPLAVGEVTTSSGFKNVS